MRGERIDELTRGRHRVRIAYPLQQLGQGWAIGEREHLLSPADGLLDHGPRQSDLSPPNTEGDEDPGVAIVIALRVRPGGLLLQLGEERKPVVPEVVPGAAGSELAHPLPCVFIRDDVFNGLDPSLSIIVVNETPYRSIDRGERIYGSQDWRNARGAGLQDSQGEQLAVRDDGL